MVSQRKLLDQAHYLPNNSDTCLQKIVNSLKATHSINSVSQIKLSENYSIKLLETKSHYLLNSSCKCLLKILNSLKVTYINRVLAKENYLFKNCSTKLQGKIILPSKMS